MGEVNLRVLREQLGLTTLSEKCEFSIEKGGGGSLKCNDWEAMRCGMKILKCIVN
jgi:hypothetical protein